MCGDTAGWGLGGEAIPGRTIEELTSNFLLYRVLFSGFQGVLFGNHLVTKTARQKIPNATVKDPNNSVDSALTLLF